MRWMREWFIGMLVGVAGVAGAQRVALPAAPKDKLRDDWSTVQVAEQTAHKLALKLVRQPDKRIVCNVASVTAEQIACRHALGAATVYRVADIATVSVVSKRDHGALIGAAIFGVLGGAAGYGVMVLGTAVLAASIPLGVAEVVFGVGFVVALIGDAIDQPEDKMIYERPAAVVLAAPVPAV